jgi:uncharacterized protein
MYSRLLKPPDHKSFFLFGPRGTGKTSWVKEHFPNALYIDLLASQAYTELLARPERLEELIPKGFDDWIIIDEVQRVPELLNEVHRLIENQNRRFILTGSSARKLRKKGVNLLAGRALTYTLHPLTAIEMGLDFDPTKALQYGMLPSVATELDPKKYLEAYFATYLREEVLQEGLIRNLGGFARFLETASFSQGGVLNISEVSREAAANRKVIEGYFEILEDLLLSVRIPVFTKRAKRRLVAHPKFYFFDTGVFRAIRPRGPLDSESEILGAAMETLVFQHLRAMNDYLNSEYKIYFWRTSDGLEVDFILYGPKGLLAIEVKSSTTLHPTDFHGLQAFQEEFPIAKAYLIYGGSQERFQNNITILPLQKALQTLPQLL